MSNKAQLAFCDVAEIIVQQQMKLHTVSQSLICPPVLNLSERCLVRKWIRLLGIFNYWTIVFAEEYMMRHLISQEICQKPEFKFQPAS